MTMFKFETFAVRNRSSVELELVLEPEGDVIVLPPGSQCEVSADDGQPDIRDFEVEYGVGRITVYAACRKQVVVGGVRVR